MEIKDERMNLVKEEDIRVSDMSLTNDGDYLISSYDNYLRLYMKDGSLTPFKDFSPLATSSVHVNEQKEILVGHGESESIHIEPDSIRRIVVLNQTGEIVHTYEYDKNNETIYRTM